MGTTGFDVTKFVESCVRTTCCQSAAPQTGAEPQCQGGGGHDGGLWHPQPSQLQTHTQNARAELGVKTVKRMLMDIVSAKGILDRAMVSRALLQLRNTPDRDSKLSPAKALYARELRDFLPSKQELINTNRAVLLPLRPVLKVFAPPCTKRFVVIKLEKLNFREKFAQL
jgi:hypothetical protein